MHTEYGFAENRGKESHPSLPSAPVPALAQRDLESRCQQHVLQEPVIHSTSWKDLGSVCVRERVCVQNNVSQESND